MLLREGGIMDIYLDLSFFSSIIIHLLCLVYLKLMYEYKNISVILYGNPRGMSRKNRRESGER